MPSEAEYRRQAEALLRMAAAAKNLRDRSDLIDEASRWGDLAAKAAARAKTRPPSTPTGRPAERPSFLDPDMDPDLEEFGPQSARGLIEPVQPDQLEQTARRRPFDLRRLFGLA
ncbi:hypothetical protein [Phenylobacterium sp.]|uniref:hypothetical protein n=1 Tax=Phenylobacterium sp. TaxID=1871053 RepID=UPI0025ECABA3|nr:hypothetical protein [Phenylobacterium sp.]